MLSEIYPKKSDCQEEKIGFIGLTVPIISDYIRSPANDGGTKKGNEAMTNVTTNIFKGERNHSLKGWQAESRLKLSDGRELEITTHKGWNGELESRAKIYHIDGYFRTHKFIFGDEGGKEGDYSRKLLATKERCTEKSVRAQHSQAIAQLDTILAEVEAHYAARQ